MQNMDIPGEIKLTKATDFLISNSKKVQLLQKNNKTQDNKVLLSLFYVLSQNVSEICTRL